MRTRELPILAVPLMVALAGCGLRARLGAMELHLGDTSRLSAGVNDRGGREVVGLDVRLNTPVAIDDALQHLSPAVTNTLLGPKPAP